MSQLDIIFAKNRVIIKSVNSLFIVIIFFFGI